MTFLPVVSPEAVELATEATEGEVARPGCWSVPPGLGEARLPSSVVEAANSCSAAAKFLGEDSSDCIPRADLMCPNRSCMAFWVKIQKTF